MSKKSKPTTEELRFVYDLINKGLRGKDLPDEYLRLYESGQLMFPLRTDKRFFQDRIRELEAASEVLLEDLKKRADPVIAKKREEHYNQLAEVAEDILGLLSRMKPRNDGKYEYGKRDLDGYINTFAGSRKDLIEQLHSNIENAEKKHQEMNLFERFLVHLTSETPASPTPNISELYKYADSNPVELVELLNILAQRKFFIGKCRVCEGLTVKKLTVDNSHKV